MKIKVTLKRSSIGRIKKHRLILKSLGLRKINQSVIHNDVPSVRGMTNKVSYMVEVVELSPQKAKKLAEKQAGN